MSDLILDRVILAKGWLFRRVGGGKGHGGCVVIVEINEVSVGTSVPPPSLGISLRTVSSKVSFLSTIETGASGPGGSILSMLGSVGVSDFHESSICGIGSVRSSLVAVCPGTVEVHGDCQVVYVSWGIGRVVLRSSWISGGVPVVARGVLLEVWV